MFRTKVVDKIKTQIYVQ